ncbi:hypothetical protein NUACC26_055040 [Scytonema sp. NUACC26]
MLINDLFHQIGMILKETSDCTEYLLDSFPVLMCDNIRIFNVRLIKSEEYRGYIASKKRYFYGVKIQLLTTRSGIPVEFVFLPGSASDVRALNALRFSLVGVCAKALKITVSLVFSREGTATDKSSEDVIKTANLSR